MSDVATRDLATLEGIIERGLSTFVDVGTALAEIRDRDLYQKTHATFDAYCQERFGFKRAHAYRMIEAADIRASLSPIGDTPLPIRESQVRELARIEPERRAETWQAVVEEHGPSATAAEVKQVIRDRAPQHTAHYPVPVVEVRPMLEWVKSLPEETVDALATDFYTVQLPDMLDQAVIAVCQRMWTAARAGTKELNQIAWELVTDAMLESKTITDHLRYLDRDLEAFFQAIANVRPKETALRRIK
jgi:hypothetical protein